MLSTEERDALRRPGTRVAAYEHFLRGRQVLRESLTTVSFQKAEDEFRRAIEIDPGYAPAYAGLAQVYSWRVEWMGGGEYAAQNRDRASRQALELGPTLSESHLARGDVLSIQKDYSGRRARLPGGHPAQPGLVRRLLPLRAEQLPVRQVRAVPRPLSSRRGGQAGGLPVPDPGRDAPGEARADRRDPRGQTRGPAPDGAAARARPQRCTGLILGSGALLEQDPARALEWVARAVAAAPDEPSVTNNAACTYARMGMKEAALGSWRRASVAAWGSATRSSTIRTTTRSGMTRASRRSWRSCRRRVPWPPLRSKRSSTTSTVCSSTRSPARHRRRRRSSGGLGLPLTPERCRETTGLRMDEAVAYWAARLPWTGVPLEEVVHGSSAGCCRCWRSGRR